MTLAQFAFPGVSPTKAPDHEPGAVDRILNAVREHLGMDVAFASRVSNGKVVIQYADPHGSALVEVGQVYNGEETYCQRIVDGRLPYLIPDAALVPEVADLDCTRKIPVGAHLSVPLRLSDGSVYGTFCCFSRTADPSLNERDLHTLQAFAEIAAGQIEAELALTELREGTLERIREVVERGSINMAFQPIHDLADGTILGFEALSRFPDHEERPPSEWFDEAQQVGLGGKLELAALTSALAALAYLPRELYLSVNLSPDTLLDPAVWELLEQVRDRRVIVEVTEHAIIEDYGPIKRALHDLRDKVRIAIDDAGAGYSGLRHILDLRPDMIKLDMSLTRDINRDPARAAMTTALVRFARDIGSVIVAEGVETEEEYEALKSLQVDAAQGHYLHRPMPLLAAAQLVGGPAGKS